MPWSFPQSGWTAPSGGGTLSDANPLALTPDIAAAPGTGTEASRADHVHNVPAGAAVGLALANAEGTAADFARSDHTHQRSFARNLTDADSPYTVIAGDHTLYCDATAGAIVIDAPAIAAQASRELRVIKTDASENPVTFEPAGAETVNGQVNLSLRAQYGAIVVQVDATPTGWFVVDDYPPNLLWLHRDWPEGAAQANNTIIYRLWSPLATRLLSIRAYMQGINTQGTYVLTVTNAGTGNTMLSAATFDMDTLVAATVTELALTATEADLRAAALGLLNIQLVSDNGAFDGTGIYVELVLEEM